MSSCRPAAVQLLSSCFLSPLHTALTAQRTALRVTVGLVLTRVSSLLLLPCVANRTDFHADSGDKSYDPGVFRANQVLNE